MRGTLTGFTHSNPARASQPQARLAHRTVKERLLGSALIGALLIWLSFKQPRLYPWRTLEPAEPPGGVQRVRLAPGCGPRHPPGALRIDLLRSGLGLIEPQRAARDGTPRKDWSGQGDSNSRPSAPKADALPDCAMPRLESGTRRTRSVTLPDSRATDLVSRRCGHDMRECRFPQRSGPENL